MCQPIITANCPWGHLYRMARPRLVLEQYRSWIYKSDNNNNNNNNNAPPQSAPNGKYPTVFYFSLKLQQLRIGFSKCHKVPMMMSPPLYASKCHENVCEKIREQAPVGYSHVTIGPNTQTWIRIRPVLPRRPQIINVGDTAVMLFMEGCHAAPLKGVACLH